MSRGHVCLVLHAHMPFIRHPEHEDFLEEGWLRERLSEQGRAWGVEAAEVFDAWETPPGVGPTLF